jgi:ubiquinone/menaquinone biosynthesis C-methylase UbiE
MRRLLNVGGNSKLIPLPEYYKDFDHVLLDIDPSGKPDIVCDARKLSLLDPNQFDTVYCSHNLEHYFYHEVPTVLAGFLHVLKEGGMAHIRVPDIGELIKKCAQENIDLEDQIYQSALGPIMVIDVFYGYTKQIEKSGESFFAHKTGFTQKSLLRVLLQSGFGSIYRIGSSNNSLEINVLAFKGQPTTDMKTLMGLPSNA